MGLSTLDTPCLILDRARLERNTMKMTERFQDFGIMLRPHMKTAKSINVANLSLKENFGGITVSTLKEAEYFADHGITDIIYAISMTPDKLPRLAALIKRGINVISILDQVSVAKEISDRAVELEVILDVLVELDSGEKRAGVMPDSDDLIKVGEALHEFPGTRLKGVLTHAGQSYQGRSIAAMQQFAEEERLCAVTAAEKLREAGLLVSIVSIGSTPTATHGLSYEGITEIRCGVYMFGDVFQSEIFSCDQSDIALSVLATVIGHRKDMNCALIDAGGLALSKDRSTGAPGLPEDIGFGIVMDGSGSHRIGNVKVGHVYQEHGMLVAEGDFPFDELPVGSRVRVLPNHACMTAAMYDSYNVVNGTDDSNIVVWPRINGW